jgi:phospholipid transport system substrate-binding protein
MRLAASGHATAVHLCILLAAVAGDITVRESIPARAAVGIDVADTYQKNEAQAFVQASIDKGYGILNNKELSAEERQQQFRDFVISITDAKRVALFTLGRYTRTASESEIDSFMAAYQELVTAMYQGYFDWYTGQMLRVASSVVRSPDDVIVYADVLGPNGTRQFKLGFRVRKNEAQKNIVTDLQFEGIWIALSQRDDFTSFLQQNGGDFAALTTEIHKRTQHFKEAWAPPVPH